MRISALAIITLLLLSACGPDIGDLAKGEEGKVARAYGGDTLVLESGLRVFLAEVDAPRGEQAFANQAQAELEALTLHREVRLAYGGTRRWVPRTPRDDGEPPQETAIAHVFVKSEGGRWFWLQHELIGRGAAFVRPRADNHARVRELLAVEDEARANDLGLWALRDYEVMSAGEASAAITAAGAGNCRTREARFALVEGRVARVDAQQRRAALYLEDRADAANFSIAVFGDGFATWDGPAFASLDGKRIRARGRLGAFSDAPQLCVDHASEIEVLN